MPKYEKVQMNDPLMVTKNGAVRSTNDGKGRFDLLSVHAILRLAKHYQNGAVKYKDRNWEVGMYLSRYIDSAIRHLFKHLGGDRSEDHLAAAMWNIAAIIDHEERIERGLLDSKYDDLPKVSIFRDDEFSAAPKTKKKTKKGKRKNGTS